MIHNQDEFTPHSCSNFLLEKHFFKPGNSSPEVNVWVTSCICTFYFVMFELFKIHFQDRGGLCGQFPSFYMSALPSATGFDPSREFAEI